MQPLLRRQEIGLPATVHDLLEETFLALERLPGFLTEDVTDCSSRLERSEVLNSELSHSCIGCTAFELDYQDGKLSSLMMSVSSFMINITSLLVPESSDEILLCQKLSAVPFGISHLVICQLLQ